MLCVLQDKLIDPKSVTHMFKVQLGRSQLSSCISQCLRFLSELCEKMTMCIAADHETNWGPSHRAAR